MTLLRRAATGILPVAVALAAFVLGLQLQAEDGGARLGDTQLIDAGPMAGPFEISGQVEGLYPGAHSTLTLSLHNTNPYGLRIDTVGVTVGTTDKPGCASSNVVVGPFSGPILLPANGTVPVDLAISMLGSAPDACQGATFPLIYSGSGQRFPLPTEIRVDPVILKIIPLKVTFGTFTARLQVQGTTEPVPGKTISFKIGTRTICTAVTGAGGLASCGGPVPSLLSVLNNYWAEFAGDATHEPSKKGSALIQVYGA